MIISLVRVPTIIGESANTAPICPPIGLAYLNGVIDPKKWDINIIDSIGNYPYLRKTKFNGKSYQIFGQTIEEIVENISVNTDIILVSVMFTQDWPYARKLIQHLRFKSPHTIIIAGGEHITAAPEFNLLSTPELDCCVIGEGEETLKEILDKFYQLHSLPQDIPGTCLLNTKGEYIQNKRRPRINHINDISWPNWTDFPLKNYFKGGHGFGVNLGRTMPIIASRGCPFQCTFCSSPLMWTTRWSARSPEDVIKEIKFYIQRYNVSNFDFYDLTAIIRKDWILSFCQLLIREKIKITWQLPSGTRSEAIDSEVAALLYESGCRNLSFAPESGSERLLKIIKKKIQLSRMYESMKSCVKNKLSIKANIICGFPEETFFDLIKTYKLILKMAWIGIDDMSVNQFTPYPGSELFEKLIKENQLKMDETYFESLTLYSSMTKAYSFNKNMPNFTIISFKFISTFTFYAISMLIYPKKFIRLVQNILQGTETTRMEKTLHSYLFRFYKNREAA
ncbi:MAG: hypothetical protein A3G92_03860 [Deltaproteobacteria bacterium RIFCSPLOWO2_12_FULL_38_8]|nr:MAG: hypothetical protein A3G92_03860 [Deltaproteobacteria bacterium RIFCSPLOWO2_12_FULL_38_8]